MGGIDTSNSSNNTFPTASGAFGAHTSGKRVAFNTAFNDSTESSGASDESDKTSAYAGALFKKGGIDQVLAEATASTKPLKITGQVIDKFNGDITHWPLFREQFVKLAHRPGNFSDDIERFYFLLSQLEGEAKKWVSDTPPVKGCYQHAADQLDTEQHSEHGLVFYAEVGEPGTGQRDRAGARVHPLIALIPDTISPMR
ncbi:hypothetical protein AAVH_18977 [Aphelenchoides avenae]|nr:hypothetical protein AAVH_18977 [Aphelenchus avenae]